MADKTAAFLALPDVNLADIKPGDRVVVDAGFTCIGAWRECTVEVDDRGEKFIPCTAGRHYLDGQEDFDNPDKPLVGLRRAA